MDYTAIPLGSLHSPLIRVELTCFEQFTLNASISCSIDLMEIPYSRPMWAPYNNILERKHAVYGDYI